MIITLVCLHGLINFYYYGIDPRTWKLIKKKLSINPIELSGV